MSQPKAFRALSPFCVTSSAGSPFDRRTAMYYSVFDSDPDRSFQTQWNFETEAKATMATIKLLMDSKGMSEDRQRTVFDSTLAGQKIHLIDAGFEIIEHERKLPETHRHPKKRIMGYYKLKEVVRAVLIGKDNQAQLAHEFKFDKVSDATSIGSYFALSDTIGAKPEIINAVDFEKYYGRIEYAVSDD